MLPKIGNNQSLSQQAYNAIKTAILTNQFRPKDLLREEALAATLGISRTPLRAALKRLQYEKLVTVTSTKQTIVSEVRPEDMEKVFVFRFAVEPIAAKVAATVIGKKGLRQIEECLAQQADHIAAGNIEKIIATELQFSSLLAQHTGNEFFVDSIEMINTYMQRFLSLAPTTGQDVAHSVKEHQDIYTAIAERNASAAEEKTRVHLTNVAARLGYSLPL